MLADKLPGVGTRDLAIWGSTGAGKTTYLGMLYLAQDFGRWVMEPLDTASTEFIIDITDELAEGRFPSPTDSLSEPEVYRYSFHKPPDVIDEFSGWFFGERGQRVFNVSFVDAGGGCFEDPDNYPWLGVHETVWQYLAGCDGILVMLDPTRDRREYFRTTLRAFTRLKQEIQGGQPGPLRKYMALCFTKMDQEPHIQHFHEPDRYAPEVLGDLTMRIIHQTLSPGAYRFFSVSSIGTIQKGALREANVVMESEEYRIKDPEAIAPMGIFAPLEWLFKQIVKRSD